MNYNDYIVFDFETGSVNPMKCVPLSLAAKAYGARSLKPIQGADFLTLMKPQDNEWNLIEKEALEINKITIEQLKAAPDRQVAWEAFVKFVNRFNKNPGNAWTAPIACGQNILNFDLIIIERLAQKYGPTDKEGRQSLFNRRVQQELLFHFHGWYEDSNDLPNYKMDTIREHFGLEKKGAHGANMVDVEQTGEMIMRFLRMQRSAKRFVPGLKGVRANAA